MRLRFPIGQSDFATLRREGLTYVDKTRFIGDVIDSGAPALLFPRPRRFGKTLALTTLQAYFERTDEPRADLFEGLWIWDAGEHYRRHFQRHPVIFVTLKDVKDATWAEAQRRIGDLVQALVSSHHATIEPVLRPDERTRAARMLDEPVDLVQLSGALRLLSEWLRRATGETVVVLVDEYDTAIHQGFRHGYLDEAIGFFRAFLSGGLKDNPHLYRGVITGILRVAKESIFSDLNNLQVHTLLSGSCASAFGFTDEEVHALAARAGVADRMEEIRAWYNGYLFGAQVIYNPWSVLCYLDDPGRGAEPYWANTSSNQLVRDLLLAAGASLHEDLQALLGGRAIVKPIQEDIVLRDVHQDPDALSPASCHVMRRAVAHITPLRHLVPRRVLCHEGEWEGP
jgi:hypothetical protein